MICLLVGMVAPVLVMVARPGVPGDGVPSAELADEKNTDDESREAEET